MSMHITLYYIKIKYLFCEVCATATNTFDLENWVSVTGVTHLKDLMHGFNGKVKPRTNLTIFIFYYFGIRKM